MRGAKKDCGAVLARGGKFLVVLALVLTTGLHWAALQSVAWTTMLAKNLRTQSFTDAVSDTFDGRHPCPLCKAIAKGKQSEQKSAAISPVLKMEFPLVTGQVVLYPPTRFTVMPVADAYAESGAAKPPLPPPRASFI